LGFAVSDFSHHVPGGVAGGVLDVLPITDRRHGRWGLLLLAVWITRIVQWHVWAGFPFSMMLPSVILPGAILMDVVLIVCGNGLFAAIFGGWLFGFTFWPANYEALALAYMPVNFHGTMASVSDMVGYTFLRSNMPEYLRIIERGTLRTFGGQVAWISGAFSAFICIIMHFLWWNLGVAMSTVKFVPNGKRMLALMGMKAPSATKAATASALPNTTLLPRWPSATTMKRGATMIIPSMSILRGISMIVTVLLGAQTRIGSWERAQEPFLRTRSIQFYDVQFDKTQVKVNEQFTVTGKAHFSEQWADAVAQPDVAYLSASSPGPVVVRVSSDLNGVPARQSFSKLELGRDYAFTLELEAPYALPVSHPPDDRGQRVGRPVGPGQWIEISGNGASFAYPVTR